MNSGDLKRASLSRVAPWARSVIVCAINYNTDHPYSTRGERSQLADGSPATPGAARIITTPFCAA